MWGENMNIGVKYLFSSSAACGGENSFVDKISPSIDCFLICPLFAFSLIVI